jgi:hypothetical protein
VRHCLHSRFTFNRTPSDIGRGALFWMGGSLVCTANVTPLSSQPGQNVPILRCNLGTGGGARGTGTGVVEPAAMDSDEDSHRRACHHISYCVFIATSFKTSISR